MNTVLQIIAWLIKRKVITHIITPIIRESSRVGLQEWRSQSHLTRNAALAINDPNVKAMLDVVENENPAKWHLPVNSTVEERAGHQRFVEGYNMCLRNFQALAEYEQPKGEMPEATFGTDEKLTT